MSPQNYYARRQAGRRREVDLGLVLELVSKQRMLQPRLGARKVFHLIRPELKKAKVKMGRDRLFQELGKAGMLVERKAAQWPRTTSFDANLPVFNNLVKELEPTGRSQVWVSDITYIRTMEGFLYLALITDMWSRKIVGFEMGETLEAKESLKALEMALQGLQIGEKPIHHSDRGCQYASYAYVQRATSAGLKMSMTEENHTAENAMAERVNGILKQEYWMDAEFTNKREARRAASEAVSLYNNRRPHTALNFKTPEEMHSASRN
jgi:putative transposase